MTDIHSPDLEAVKEETIDQAEEIFKEAKENYEGEGVEEARVKAAEEYYRRAKSRMENPSPYESPKYIYSIRELQNLIVKFYKAKDKVTDAMIKRSTEEEKADGYIEDIVDQEDGLEEGEMTFLLATKGVNHGKLRITHHLPIISDGEEIDNIETDNFYITNNGIRIISVDPKDHTKETHFISSNNPNDNIVSLSTPAALERLDKSLNLYLKSLAPK